MTDFLVTIMVPSRGRPQHLKHSLESLIERCSPENRGCFEVIVRTDDDDVETAQMLVANQHLWSKVICKPRGGGYADLHHMYNEMCSISSGIFLFLWNDDAVMLTENWDKEVAKHNDGKMCYIKSAIIDTRGRDHLLFPIIHRSYYDLCGHFSASAHNDTYVNVLFDGFPQLWRESVIKVKHIALELISQQDKTFLDAKACWPHTKAAWNSAFVQRALEEDAQKIRNFLLSQPAATAVLPQKVTPVQGEQAKLSKKEKYMLIEKYLDGLEVTGLSCIEIGAEHVGRGSGSTRFFHSYCAKRNMTFYTVDVDKKVTEYGKTVTPNAINAKGEDFLANFPQGNNVAFVYLDNFDWTFAGNESIPKVIRQAEHYRNELGFERTNASSQVAHLKQAQELHIRMHQPGFILFDDTWINSDGTCDGKGGLAIPFLVKNGFTVVEQGDIETPYVMVKR